MFFFLNCLLAKYISTWLVPQTALINISNVCLNIFPAFYSLCPSQLYTSSGTNLYTYFKMEVVLNDFVMNKKTADATMVAN